MGGVREDGQRDVPRHEPDRQGRAARQRAKPRVAYPLHSNGAALVVNPSKCSTGIPWDPPRRGPPGGARRRLGPRRRAFSEAESLIRLGRRDSSTVCSTQSWTGACASPGGVLRFQISKIRPGRPTGNEEAKDAAVRLARAPRRYLGEVEVHLPPGPGGSPVQRLERPLLRLAVISRAPQQLPVQIGPSPPTPFVLSRESIQSKDANGPLLRPKKRGPARGKGSHRGKPNVKRTGPPGRRQLDRPGLPTLRHPAAPQSL